MVPEEAFGLSTDGSDGSVFLYVGVKWKVIMFLWKLAEGSTKFFVGCVLMLMDVIYGSTITFGSEVRVCGKGLFKGV